MRALLLVLSTAILLIGCKDPGTRAYENCLVEMEKASQQATGADRAITEAEKAFAKTAGAMVQVMGNNVCKSIKTACESDPNGQICEAAITQYR